MEENKEEKAASPSGAPAQAAGNSSSKITPPKRPPSIPYDALVIPQPRLNDGLVRASFLGNVSQVLTLLSLGCNANHTLEMHPDNVTPVTMTPLAAAAYHGHAEVCKCLLNAGAKVCSTTLWGLAFSRYPEVIKLLFAQLPKKTNFDDLCRKDGSNRTLLSKAATTNNVQLCRLLLEHGASVKTASLRDAASKGYEQVCELLMDHGAVFNDPQSPSEASSVGEPLHEAAIRGDKEACRLLLKCGSPVEEIASHGSTPLYQAAKRGFDEICELLVQHGARPLGYLALKKFIDTRQAQTTGGSSSNSGWGGGRGGGGGESSQPVLADRGFLKYTAYGAAINRGHVNVVKLFLRSVPVNTADAHGWSAIHLAAAAGQDAMLQLLLQHGADANRVTENGETPLHLAVKGEHELLCKTLLQLKQKPLLALANEDGETPLHVAAAKGSTTICELLLRAGAEGNLATFDGATPLTIAVKQGCLPLCELLVSNGADVNKAETGSGKTPLMLAAENGHERICTCLIEKGALVNQPSHTAWTPLMYAAQNNHFKTCQLLLANGASPHQKGRKVSAEGANPHPILPGKSESRFKARKGRSRRGGGEGWSMPPTDSQPGNDNGITASDVTNDSLIKLLLERASQGAPIETPTGGWGSRPAPPSSSGGATADGGGQASGWTDSGVSSGGGSGYSSTWW